MEAGLSRALPTRRAGVRLELCTHSRATPSLPWEPPWTGSVCWLARWLGAKALPTHTPLFFPNLARNFFFPGSFWACSLSIFSVWSFVYTSYTRPFTLHVLQAPSPFPLQLQQLDPLLSLCTAGAVFSESPLAAIWRVLLSISSGLFIKRLWGTVTERWNFSFKILAKPLDPLCFILSILRATTTKHFQVFYEN